MAEMQEIPLPSHSEAPSLPLGDSVLPEHHNGDLFADKAGSEQR